MLIISAIFKAPYSINFYIPSYLSLAKMKFRNNQAHHLNKTRRCNIQKEKWLMVEKDSQLTFTCSKSTIKTLGKGAKCVIDVVQVFLLLTVNILNPFLVFLLLTLNK